MNEEASRYCDELWRKYYDEHPEKKAKLLEDARRANEFLAKLRESLKEASEKHSQEILYGKSETKSE